MGAAASGPPAGRGEPPGPARARRRVRPPRRPAGWRRESSGAAGALGASGLAGPAGRGADVTGAAAGAAGRDVRRAAPPDERERLRAEAAFWERLCAAVVHAAGCAGVAWDQRTPLGRMVPEVTALIAPPHAEFARRTLHNDARWRELLEREGWAAAVRESLADPAPGSPGAPP